MTSLPSIATPEFLSSIRDHPNVPSDTWYFIAAVTLSTLNRPDEIPNIFTHVVNHGSYPEESEPSREELLKIARRMREALVKAGAVAGMPKSINAMMELKKITPLELQDAPLADSPTSRSADIRDVPPSIIFKRGQALFEKIYGKAAKRVMDQLDRSGTEDLGLVARLVYGYLLSNTTILDSAETSFVLIAGLIPQDVNPQLKGHLIGALNAGATIDEVKAVRAVVLNICEAYGMKKTGNDVPAGWGWRGDVVDL